MKVCSCMVNATGSLIQEECDDAEKYGREEMKKKGAKQDW